MTLRFIDGFDHYDTTSLLASMKCGVSNTPAIESNGGRRGGGALVFTPGEFCYKAFDNKSAWVVGFALKMQSLGTGTNHHLLSFVDGTTVQVDIYLDNTGHLIVTRGSTVLATSTSVLTVEVWNYIEVKVTLDNTTGAAEVRVNGSSSGWINISDVDTCATANEYASVIRYGSTTSSGTGRIDDLYICDTDGSVNNDFLGDVRVDAYLPNGNGASSQFTGSDSDSTDNYMLVDDAAPDGDTTYVQSSTVNQIDTYSFTEMSHTPATIFGLQIVMDAKKDDSGTRSIAGVVRQSSTNYAGSNQVLSTSYVGYTDIRETDPATAAAWTKDGINSAEFGIKVAE